MIQSSIKELISIVIDRELALINCLKSLFRQSKHILCRWYININVLTKTKRYFLGPIKTPNGSVERHPSFKAFLSD